MVKQENRIIIIFLIILASVTSGCIKPANLTTEYSGDLKPITDSRLGEFKNQHSNLVIIHQPKLEKNWLTSRVSEIHINGEARYEGNATLTYLNVKAQFYDKKGTVVCEKTLMAGGGLVIIRALI